MYCFIRQNAWYHLSSSLWLLICWESHFKLPLAGMFLRSTVKIHENTAVAGWLSILNSEPERHRFQSLEASFYSWCSHQIGHWMTWNSPWSRRSIDDLCGNIVKEIWITGNLAGKKRWSWWNVESRSRPMYQLSLCMAMIFQHHLQENQVHVCSRHAC